MLHGEGVASQAEGKRNGPLPSIPPVDNIGRISFRYLHVGLEAEKSTDLGSQKNEEDHRILAAKEFLGIGGCLHSSHQTQDAGQTIQGADDEAEGQEKKQKPEPERRVCDVKIEDLYEEGELLPVSFQIKSDLFVLGDDRADDGRRSQQRENQDGELPTGRIECGTFGRSSAILQQDKDCGFLSGQIVHWLVPEDFVCPHPKRASFIDPAVPAWHEANSMRQSAHHNSPEKPKPPATVRKTASSRRQSRWCVIRKSMLWKVRKSTR